MTKPLDIPQQTIDRARRITRAATDEEAIVLAVAALDDRGGDVVRNKSTFAGISPARREELRAAFAAARESVKHLIPEIEAQAARIDQSRILPLLGTFGDFDLVDEDHNEDLQ